MALTLRAILPNESQSIDQVGPLELDDDNSSDGSTSDNNSSQVANNDKDDKDNLGGDYSRWLLILALFSSSR